MRTWSLEEAVFRAQSALAVAVQGVWDGLVGLERVTRPPRLGHDLDVEHDGAEQLAQREAEVDVLEPDSSAQVVPRNEHPAEHPAGVDSFPPNPPAGPQLDWHGWSIPAILEVLAEHSVRWGVCACGWAEGPRLHDWAEHVAPILADRIACDPARAIAALHNHTPKNDGLRGDGRYQKSEGCWCGEHIDIEGSESAVLMACANFRLYHNHTPK